MLRVIFAQPIFSVLYNGPLIGLLILWAVCRAREKYKWGSWRSLLDALVIGIAVSRFFGSTIPPSGHALFLTYSSITVKNHFYRISAVTMLMATIGLKVSWGDYRSWVYGILLGMICGGIWIYTLKVGDRAMQ
jgi:hypothetical protein